MFNLKIPCDDRRADVCPFDKTVHLGSFSSASVGDVVVEGVSLTFALPKVGGNVGGGEENLAVDNFDSDKL